MKTKILIAVLSIGLFTMSTVKAQEKAKMKVEKTEKAAFACPMQCEGEKTYNKTGSCPKCKMDLKKSENKKKPACCEGMKTDSAKMECGMNHDKMAEMYTCPMKCEGEKTYDKTGSCPKCKMDLKKKDMKKEK
jgi:membrane fusion protein, copper/silver efflux system